MASGSDANLNGVAVQKQVDCPPNAGQLIESLRDTGYDFDSAIADIVDNSIDANATTISVAITQDPDGSVGVAIVDNGCGMSETDARMSFERHATSKIRKAEDLFAIQ